MVKKILNIVLKIAAICIAYVFQLYIFNNINFYGVKANLPLVLLALISILIENKKEIYAYAVICGLLSDILFGSVVGEFFVINIFVVTILSSIKNTYKQDSKFSVIIFSTVATVVFEIVLVIFTLFAKKEVINIFVVIWAVFKKCIINIFFAYIIYLIWTRIFDRKSF